MNKSRCVLFEKGAVSTVDIELRDPQPGEVLLRAEVTCISPGTELRCLRGGQGGASQEPFIPGYAFVGRVIKSAADGVAEGQRIFCAGSKDAGPYGHCWGGHTGIALADADGLTPVPDSIDPLDASLAALGGIAANGVRQGAVQPGEKVAVVGLGVLGQLSARMHVLKGGDVVGCDLVASRVDMANKAGIRSVVATDGLKKAVEPLMPGGAIMVVDATGAPAAIPGAIELVMDVPWDQSDLPNTRYMIQGSYENSFSIPYHPAFFRQLTFLVPRNYQARDRQSFIYWLAEGKLAVRDLINRVCQPDQAAEAYEALKNPAETPGTIAIDWRNS